MVDGYYFACAHYCVLIFRHDFFRKNSKYSSEIKSISVNKQYWAVFREDFGDMITATFNDDTNNLKTLYIPYSDISTDTDTEAKLVTAYVFRTPDEELSYRRSLIWCVQDKAKLANMQYVSEDTEVSEDKAYIKNLCSCYKVYYEGLDRLEIQTAPWLGKHNYEVTLTEHNGDENRFSVQVGGNNNE